MGKTSVACFPWNEKIHVVPLINLFITQKRPADKECFRFDNIKSPLQTSGAESKNEFICYFEMSLQFQQSRTIAWE